MAAAQAFFIPLPADRTPVTSARTEFSITIAAVRLLRNIAILAIIVGSSFCSAFPQDLADTSGPAREDVSARSKNDGNGLTPDDRLGLLAAALDAHVRRAAEPDCSHLVHAVYQAAGLPYTYAPSSDLYAGVENFHRVKTPLPGDLVVWHGHVGIVIKPSRHIFFSYLSSGPGTDDYETAYWKHRGHPRFYRYVKKEFAR